MAGAQLDLLKIKGYLVSQDQSPASLKLSASIAYLFCAEAYAKLPWVNEEIKRIPDLPRVYSLAKEESQWSMAVLIGTYSS